MNTLKKLPHILWEEGSENVFADLDMPDAEEKLAKAKLAFKINEILDKKRLKQQQAAKLLNTDQSKVSLLHCGHLKDFSVERLAHFLTLLNQDVEIIVKKTRRIGYGTLKVLYA
jgi:predicted XRE-type DNA-binding protein